MQRLNFRSLGVAVSALCAIVSCPVGGQNVFINEIHYDNQGADVGEAVEIVALAGTDLSAYELHFYNGSNRNSYGSLVLSGTVQNEADTGFGAIGFAFEGIQNGAPDGIALYHLPTGSVVQFLSYEGSIVATGGVAVGEESQDIGVAETGSSPVGGSLQLTGTGSEYGDFKWQRTEAASFGSINAGQILVGGPAGATLSLTLSRIRLVESAGTSVNASVTLTPPPAEAVTLTISLNGGEGVTAPAQVILDAEGNGGFAITAEDNDVDDGDRSVRVSISDETGEQTASATLAIVDDDRMALKGEAVRVAAFNLLNGVGERGGAGFNAVAASLSRFEPDVIALQEVDSTDGFRALEHLLDDIAFEADAMHLATVDDDFRLSPYNGGDYNSGEQSLAIASRYPIKRVVQIGRDVPDSRREITRFPLYAEIDIPWADDTDDLHVICVHYKAGTRDSDRFRKAVEAYRTLEFLATEGLSGNTHNIVVLGDFNENTGNFQPASVNTGRTTFSDGSSFPVGFAVGDDITGENAITLPYNAFPSRIFGGSDFRVASPRHADRRGVNTFINGDAVRLDYIVLSNRLYTNGNRFTEVFNSEVDAGFEGLPKQGQPVDGGTSRAASDHFPLFGDLWLKPVDRITVSFSTANPEIDENSGETVRVSIVLTPPPATGEDVTIALSDSAGDLAMPETVMIAGPANSAAIEVGAAQDGRADRSRNITLVAEADGYATGYGSIFVANANASGILVISQVLCDSGAGSDALELVNASTETVNFNESPATIHVFRDGTTLPVNVADIDTGSLAPGEVIVLGDNALAAEIGAAGFIETALGIDGNDAIEVCVAGVRSDVFGRIGENPGVAWQQAGVSTRDTNLVLKDLIGIGSAGWSDPALRFEVHEGNGNGGNQLGEPPALEDPYVAWIEGFGRGRHATGHPDADPDRDALTNAAEFGYLTHPEIRDRHRAAGIEGRNALLIRRPLDGRVHYLLESSGDLRRWEITPYFEDSLTVLPDGRESVRANPLVKILYFERYFRFQVVLP